MPSKRACKFQGFARIFFNMIRNQRSVTKFFLLLAFHLPLTTFVFADWRALNSGVATDLNSVYFADSNSGWAVGNSGVILKTTDGGSTWLAQTSGVADNLQDVRFVNASTGIAVGNNGVALKTLNGGTTWSTLNSGMSDILYSVFWSDMNTVWAVGQLGRIRKSTDSGNSWSNGDPNAGAPIQHLRSVFFINSSTGWAVGNSGTLLRTYNGDTSTITWTTQTSGTSQNLRGIFFVSVSTGWLVGEGGVIRKSTDSGSTWTSQISTNTNFTSVHFVSTETGWAVGNIGTSHIIVKSTDNGGTFFTETSTAANDLLKVFGIHSQLAYSVGAAGTILKNSTAALATSSSLSSEPPQGSLKAINNLFDPLDPDAAKRFTELQYSLLNSGRVTIRIYNMQGRLVKTLLDESKDAGAYKINWDGKNEDGETVASGIYLAHIEAPKFSKSSKIAVVE